VTQASFAFALDVPTLSAATPFLDSLGGTVPWMKVGLELFVREGAPAVRRAAEKARVFLDLKLHDIPETVDRAVASAAALGASLLTIHAAGGPRMIAAAVKRAERDNPDLRICAVTVLTSFDEAEMKEIGVVRSVPEQVQSLARMAIDVGCSAFVCSVHEAAALRHALGDQAYLVTPGIRDGAGGDDQKRVASVEAAVDAGSNLLVVGRPIRDAADPAAAARSIALRIAKATGSHP
jgi:orotidine-5'-phosphate decarboxylase